MVVRTPRVQMPQTGGPTPINLTRMTADNIYCVNVTCLGRIGQTALPCPAQAGYVQISWSQHDDAPLAGPSSTS